MSKKIALITGANKGIGLETARQLGKEGITIIAAARNKEKGLTIIPIQLFINERGLAKLQIALAKGKKRRRSARRW